MRRIWTVLWLGVLLVFSITSCGENRKQQVLLESIETEDKDTEDKDTEDDDQEEKNQIYVYVCGAVSNVGVYAMPKGSRVYEAVRMAGGFTSEAAVTQINQAEVLEDEAYIYVPTKAEAASGTTTGNQTGSGTKSDLIDLNHAGKEELMTLPGVGEAKASQIIQYREEHGRFKKIEDIMNISGIKEGLFEKIRDYIKV